MGSVDAPVMNLPLASNPSIRADMGFPLGAVETMAVAPPIFCSSSAAFWVAESM